MKTHLFSAAVLRQPTITATRSDKRPGLLVLTALLVCFVAQADLVGFWSFSEGTGSTFHDGTTNHNDLTSHSPTFSTNTPYAAPGYSAHFNGQNDYASCPISTVLEPTGAFSVASWVEIDSLAAIGQEDDIISCIGPYQGSGGYNFGFGGYNYPAVSLGMFYRDSNWQDHYSGGTVTAMPGGFQAGVWYHVAAVYSEPDSSHAQIITYVNGRQLSDSGPMPNHVAYGNNPTFFLGKNWDGNGAGSRELNGSLYGVRVYNTALTAGQIAALYTEIAPAVQAPFVVVQGVNSNSFQFSFTNSPGVTFTVLGTTNLAAPAGQWTALGSPTEGPAGVFRFTDAIGTNGLPRFYQVRWP